MSNGGRKKGDDAMNPADIQSHPIESREQWLALREVDVTASVAGALFGVHPYQSAYSLYLLKTRQILEDPEETPAMRRGRMLEPVAAQYLLEDNPDWKITDPKVYLRDPKARVGATPDRYIEIPGRKGFGVLQIKTVEESLFKRTWMTEDGEIEPPLWIAVQAEIERHLSGASYAIVGVLRVGWGINCQPVFLPNFPGLVERAYERSRWFWDLVDRKIAPSPDYSSDGRLLERIYLNPTGAVLDMRQDNHLVELADEDHILKDQIKEGEARRKQIKAEFLHKIGTASAMQIADGRIITAKRIERKGYTVEPTSYVTVTVKQEKA